MTISAADAEKLRHAGFTEQEIIDLAEAKTATGADQPPINLDSPAWEATLKSRINWWQDKLDAGWTANEILDSLGDFYRRDPRRTPFDFLRAEYRPPKKVDYLEIARARTQAQITGELNGYKF